jgi:adenine deaminase
MIDSNLIRVARGELPADLILADARIVNVFNGEIERGNVAVYQGTIAGIGNYQNAREVTDLNGKYLTPGFIDGHVHLESSMLDVGEYARAVVSRGTLAIVTDLHEIANVCGIAGLKYILDSARQLPLDIFLMAPSCVPATHLETSGTGLDSADLSRILRWKRCIGLGEMMNYPGVLNRDEKVLAKLQLIDNQPVDGHAPGLKGNDLNAYIAAGIHSDHESVSLDEAAGKLRRGMFVMVREGSSEKNLEALLPLVTDKTCGRLMLVVDDRTGVDILKDGDIDAVLRKAVRLGLDPLQAVRMVTINPASYFHLSGLGAVAPGYRADMLVLDDLNEFHVHTVYYRGSIVAGQGKVNFSLGRMNSRQLRNTVNIKPLSPGALVFTHSSPLPVIEVVPGQIVTRRRMEHPKVVDGVIVSDVLRDLLKAVVVERHHASGNIGIGLVKGFGLQRGAIASSVAHDSHNIVAVGADDTSLLTAVKEIEHMQGGLVVADGTEVLASLPLPVAGLLSELSLEATVSRLSVVEQAAVNLGSRLPSAFSVLSFLALPVVPELRLTDLGLVDVNEFRLIP